jgi:hypothetical protein
MTRAALLDYEEAVGSGMDTQRLPMTPLAAVVAGALAGAVGTACMDTIRYVLYRRYGAGTGTAFCLLARRL